MSFFISTDAMPMKESFNDRRSFVRSFVAGSALMPGLLQELAAADGGGADPLAPRQGHYPAKAKRVIFLFMTGGVSHVDTFDPKPRLKADVGKEVKAEHPEIQDRPGYERIFLKAVFAKRFQNLTYHYIHSVNQSPISCPTTMNFFFTNLHNITRFAPPLNVRM